MYKMNSYLAIFIIFIFLNFYTTNGNAKKKRAGINIFGEDKYDDEEREKFHLQKRLHKVQELGERASKRLSNLNDYTTFYTTYLKNIMRVRVPGTVGHHEVKEFIIKTLKKFGWTVELDEFNMKTPIGVKKFTNIIATLYPKAHRRLALAAHYDSKLMTPKDGKYFLAATDSAVPCAMLLDFASLLAKNKPEVKGDKIETEVTPMLLFLDGEEAFVEWTKNDSIYGSRHLAHELEKRQHHNPNLAKSVSMLEALDAFVLFDLLGTKNPTIYNFWETTSHLYKSMQSIENKLRRNGALKGSGRIFVGPPTQQMMIEDDHVPFLIRGVPILHLIPVPFPVEWHTLDDNADALDSNTIEDLLKIFRQFLLGYFHLQSS